MSVSDLRTTEAVMRLKTALEGIPRGTKFDRPGKTRGRATGGALVEVFALDVVAAAKLAQPPEDCQKAQQLAHGAQRRLEIQARIGDPNPPRVLCQADDLFLLLDQIPTG